MFPEIHRREFTKRRKMPLATAILLATISFANVASAFGFGKEVTESAVSLTNPAGWAEPRGVSQAGNEDFLVYGSQPLENEAPSERGGATLAWIIKVAPKGHVVWKYDVRPTRDNNKLQGSNLRGQRLSAEGAIAQADGSVWALIVGESTFQLVHLTADGAPNMHLNFRSPPPTYPDQVMFINHARLTRWNGGVGFIAQEDSIGAEEGRRLFRLIRISYDGTIELDREIPDSTGALWADVGNPTQLSDGSILCPFRQVGQVTLIQFALSGDIRGVRNLEQEPSNGVLSIASKSRIGDNFTVVHSADLIADTALELSVFTRDLTKRYSEVIPKLNAYEVSRAFTRTDTSTVLLGTYPSRFPWTSGLNLSVVIVHGSAPPSDVIDLPVDNYAIGRPPTEADLSGNESTLLLAMRPLRQAGSKQRSPTSTTNSLVLYWVELTSN